MNEQDLSEYNGMVRAKRLVVSREVGTDMFIVTQYHRGGFSVMGRFETETEARKRYHELVNR